ncbi:MAG: NAD-binding protein, partial [Clostridia bacterium]|nr:NAD-binding protein [Clostridia bacterium]
LAANEMVSILKFPSAIKIETFSRGNFEMVEIRLKKDSELDGVRLCDLRSKYHAQVLVCAVQRGEKVYIPSGNFVLRGGDKIGITASPSEITKFMRNLSIIQKKTRSTMIIGGSRTAYYLAKSLLAAGNEVKIIELDEQRCIELVEALPDKAVILNNDGAQQDFLIELGLRSVDAFVSLTGMDEENILLSYFANTNGVPKVISKVNREEFVRTAHRMGLECVISPKDIVSDRVVSYARALENSRGSKVEALYKLMDGEAEALEFKVSGDFSHVDTPLKKLSLKPDTLIAGIIRDRKPIIPSGDDTIQAGDSVVVITSGQILADLSDIVD